MAALAVALSRQRKCERSNPLFLSSSSLPIQIKKGAVSRTAPTAALGVAPAQRPPEPNEAHATHQPSIGISDVAVGNRFVDGVSKVRPSDVPHNPAIAPNGLQAKEGGFPATQRDLLLQERPRRGCTTSWATSLQMPELVRLGSQSEFSIDCPSLTGPFGRQQCPTQLGQPHGKESPLVFQTK